MGEAWSDWYAMDYLVGQGLFTDTAADGDLLVGEYVGAATGPDPHRADRLQGRLDRTRPAPAPAAPGTGGYTYGDFGKIIGRPEVHADGEIWGQTLWDLRDALGQSVTEMLVTRAMELSPGNPSFLDMRNSILQADRGVRRRAPRHDLEGVRPPRHGLLRRCARRRRRDPGRGLQHAAAGQRADRHADRHGDRLASGDRSRRDRHGGPPGWRR